MARSYPAATEAHECASASVGSALACTLERSGSGTTYEGTILQGSPDKERQCPEGSASAATMAKRGSGAHGC